MSKMQNKLTKMQKIIIKIKIKVAYNTATK